MGGKLTNAISQEVEELEWKEAISRNNERGRENWLSLTLISLEKQLGKIRPIKKWTWPLANSKWVAHEFTQLIHLPLRRF
jgi:hypothetical protein